MKSQGGVDMWLYGYSTHLLVKLLEGMGEGTMAQVVYQARELDAGHILMGDFQARLRLLQVSYLCKARQTG